MAKFLDDTGLAKLIELIKARFTTVEGVANKNKTDIATLNSEQDSQDARIEALEDADNNFLAKSGGTMTGDINMGTHFVKSTGAPTAGADLTNKTYVDAQVGGVRSTASAAQSTANAAMPKSGGTFTGNVTMGEETKLTGIVTPSVAADAANKGYVDSQVATATSAASAAQTTANAAMPKSGGTFTGNVTMGEKTKLTGIATPSATGDAANKGYVDSQVKTATDAAAAAQQTANEAKTAAGNVTALTTTEVETAWNAA